MRGAARSRDSQPYRFLPPRPRFPSLSPPPLPLQSWPSHSAPSSTWGGGNLHEGILFALILPNQSEGGHSQRERVSFLGALGPARSPLTHLEAKPGTWHPPSQPAHGGWSGVRLPQRGGTSATPGRGQAHGCDPSPQGRERCDCPQAGPHSHHTWPSRGQGEGHQQTDSGAVYLP